jgi:glycosyltransferase involved in cell wall biosynthesis
VRCFSTLSPCSSIVSRLLENFSFGLSSSLYVLFNRRPSVIYANTWPFIAAGLVSLVARLRKIPIVISVHDVYPESLVAQGRLLEGHWLLKWMHRIDGWIAQHAQAVVVISEQIFSIYRDQRKVLPDRLHIVYNWADEGSITPQMGANFIRLKYKIPEDAFLLVYGGNIGAAAGVETVIRAFGDLTDIHDLYLLVAGEGSNLVRCRKLAERTSPSQVIFHSPWPSGETSQVLRSANILVLPPNGRQSLVSVPSKFIYYMFAARPVIAMAMPGTDVANLIEKSGCGWIIEPDQPQALAEKVRLVKSLPEQELIRRGQAGRDYAMHNLTRSKNLPALIQIIEQVARV